jgi:hypothetical protein
LSTAPAALASHNETVFFEAPTQLLNPAERPAAITQLQDLGVHAVRILLNWGEVAPNPDSHTKPAVDLTNPASYDWGQYAALIDELHGLGWKVLLSVTAQPPSGIPCWASACARNHVTNPNPADFGQFMEAVGREFGGDVKLYSIWNEPNQPQFLMPQIVKGKIVSATIYRNLFIDGYAGLRASGNFAGMTVLMGETSPVGSVLGDIPAPLAFLRGVLCLNSHYVKARSCAKLPANGYAQHPYAEKTGPFWQPSGPGAGDDVTIGTLGRLVTALNRAGDAGAINKHLPIYITEFGIQSVPDPAAVSVAQQAEYLAISEHLAWGNPRVVSYDQYLLTDDPPLPGNIVQRWSGFQTGLEYVSGQQKPAYNGWRLPLSVTRKGSKVSLWGLVRPAGVAASGPDTGSSGPSGVSGPSGASATTGPTTTSDTSVLVEYSSNGGNTWRPLLNANIDTATDDSWSASAGFVNGRVWRVQWTSSTGTVYDGATTRAYTSSSPKPAS